MSNKNSKTSLTPKPSADNSTLAKRLKKAEDKSVMHAHKFIVRRWTSMGDVRRHVISWLLLVGFLLLVVGIQLLWYRDSYTKTAPANNTVYVEGALGPVKTLNPIYASSSAEQSLAKLIFSQPMQYDTTGNLGYDLLSNLEISEDETIYTITLRNDIKWHDGQPLTADDLIFTIDLLKDPVVKASSFSVWKNVETKKVNETTVELKLSQPLAPFKHYLTFSVLPKHLLKDVDPISLKEDEFSLNPVGSGPFKFKFMQDGDTMGSSKQAVHLVRNDDYYLGVPKLSRFQMLVYDSQETLLDALKHNEVNGLADLLPSQLSKVDEKKYDINSMPTQGGVYMLFNTSSDRMSELKMRQAVKASINTDEIIKNISGGRLSSLYTPIITSETDLEKPKFDPDTAKILLDELGWSQSEGGIYKKDGQDLRFKVAVIKSPELELVADEVTKQLNSMGIKTDTQILDLEDVEQGALQNTLQPRDFDILINRINIGADPDVFAYWHSSQATKNGLNFSNYKNDIADDALVSARSKRNPELRQAKYKTFMTQWLKDVPGVGLYQTSANYVSLKSTKSFANDLIFVSPTSRYSDVIYWSTGSSPVYKTP